jgi:hypothetical protein
MNGQYPRFKISYFYEELTEHFLLASGPSWSLSEAAAAMRIGKDSGRGCNLKTSGP